MSFKLALLCAININTQHILPISTNYFATVNMNILIYSVRITEAKQKRL